MANSVINEILNSYHILTPWSGKLFARTIMRLSELTNSKMIHLS